jgi:hypothetical protein
VCGIAEEIEDCGFGGGVGREGEASGDAIGGGGFREGRGTGGGGRGGASSWEGLEPGGPDCGFGFE